MGFHYARDHDLAGFWGEVCELAHRVHREAALLAPTPVADLEKTLNIGPTQRPFRQVSACHQDFEIPAQALDEQLQNLWPSCFIPRCFRQRRDIAGVVRPVLAPAHPAYNSPL